MPFNPEIAKAWKAWLRHAQKDMSLFESALRDPKAAQFALLKRILSQSVGTAWARLNCIHQETTPEEFRKGYPVQDPSDYAPWTDRIKNGEQSVLTKAPVERLVPTSGSTGPHKLIPMTEFSRREFHSAVNLWIGGLMRMYPEMMHGRLYIATSPSISPDCGRGHVPVEYADDTAYLHPEVARLMPCLSIVPPNVSQLRSDAWKQATRKALMDAQDLSFVSLWHPGYLQALFTEQELEQLSGQWSRLSVVSTWSDGACANAADDLMDYFPQATHSPKGLWLTEGVVSLPWDGAYPIALNSTFVEFENSDGSLLMAHEIKAGEVYRPVITNHTGLYRYRTGDLVEVTGFIHEAPSIRFLGRADKVCDLCGEKLSEAQVELAFKKAGIASEGILVPNTGEAVPYYECWLPRDFRFPEDLAPRLEHCLMNNPHYAWARTLGQLGPLSITYHPATDIRKRIVNPSGAEQRHIKGIRLLQ